MRIKVSKLFRARDDRKFDAIVSTLSQTLAFNRASAYVVERLQKDPMRPVRSICPVVEIREICRIKSALVRGNGAGSLNWNPN